MAGNSCGITASQHESPQGSVRNQGRSADRISGFFIVVVVIAGRGVARFAYDREAVWRVAEENVRDFFHQCSTISLLAVRRIEDHQLPAIRQRARASAARPLIRSFTQQMCARFRRQTFDAVEIHDQEFRELGQGKRVERLLTVDARKVPQTERAQFKLFSLFAGRQKIQHAEL